MDNMDKRHNVLPTYHKAQRKESADSTEYCYKEVWVQGTAISTHHWYKYV